MMLMIRMDFGFFSPSAGENRWLREELVYPGTNIYYAIMIEDVTLRLAWAAGLGLSKVIIVHHLNYLLSNYIVKFQSGSGIILKRSLAQTKL